MGSVSSPMSHGGGSAQGYDPAKYLGTPGQSESGPMGDGSSQKNNTTPEFVQSMAKIGMDLQDKLQTLSSQSPEAAEDFRIAGAAIKKAMAKILTTNSRAMEPRPPAMA